MTLRLVERELGALDLVWQEGADRYAWGALLYHRPDLFEHFLGGSFPRGSFSDFLQRMLRAYNELGATGTFNSAAYPPPIAFNPGTAPLPLPTSDTEPAAAAPRSEVESSATTPEPPGSGPG